MKKNARTRQSSKSARRGSKTTVKNLTPQNRHQGGFSFTKTVDKTSPQ